MFKIVELELDEIDKIEALMKTLCLYRNQEFDPKRFKEGIERRLKNDHDKIFVIKKVEENKVIAMLIADFDKNMYEGYIKSVIVDDEYRSLGMGENLIQAALEYFQDQNAVNIKINIDEAETRAFHLYSKVGFKPELLPEEEKVKIMKIKMD
ncbi:MAG: GNAT family N-acetyltransferase [Candidatus Hodarchaeota archaeon]